MARRNPYARQAAPAVPTNRRWKLPSPYDAVFTIDHWEFRIPNGYVQMAGKDGALLNAEGPDVKPKSKPWIGPWGENILMLVEPKPAYASLKSRLTILLNLGQPYRAGENQYGLERFISENTHYVGMLSNDDIFVDRDSEGLIHTIINCAIPTYNKYGICDAQFFSDNIRIELTFSQISLSQWREIKKNSLIFLFNHGRRL